MRLLAIEINWVDEGEKIIPEEDWNKLNLEL